MRLLKRLTSALYLLHSRFATGPGRERHLLRSTNAYLESRGISLAPDRPGGLACQGKEEAHSAAWIPDMGSMADESEIPFPSKDGVRDNICLYLTAPERVVGPCAREIENIPFDEE